MDANITEIMDKENEDSYEPLIGQVTKDNQEDWQAMVQDIFEVWAFRSYEYVTDEPAEMFSRLDHVEYVHFEGGLRKARILSALGIDVLAFPPKPLWHERSITHYLVGPYRSYHIIDGWICPFYYEVAFFFPGYFFWEFL